jgi:GNAT superfamily N-acetyltransferase
MEGVREWLAAFGPSALMTYALVVKRGSRHVPNYFGVVIEDYDRAYFLLDVIPNNRVMPYGTIRRLREEDLNKPYVRTGHDDYDRLSWSDHWYDVRTDPRRRVYVYEHGGRLLGVLSFILREKTSVLIDLVARDGDAQRKGIGGHLVRWAITQGRCACCPVADLWSEPRAVEAYRRLGFDEAGGQTMELGNTTLHRMRMKLLYNLPATEMSALAPDLGSPLRHDFPQGDE